MSNSDGHEIAMQGGSPADDDRSAGDRPPVAGTFQPLSGPELVFGVAGAIGADLTLVCSVLKDILREVGYERSRVIQLSDLLRLFGRNKDIPLSPMDRRTNDLMDAGDAIRRDFARADAMALLSIPAIQKERKLITGDHQTPAPRAAYILNSLKRPEEVSTLRRVYGRAFYLIAAFADREVRVTKFAARIAESYFDFDRDKYRKVSEKLINRDEADLTKTLGQDVRDTFPAADVFIDATNGASIAAGLGRFVDLVFGNPFETPTPDELGMFFARAAALRSADLSRQVGAVVIGGPGEVLGIGCNDVPRPGGGHYWPGDPDDARDFVLGYDTNARIKSEMLGEIFSILQHNKWLAEPKASEDVKSLVAQVLEEGEAPILRDTQITNILEFGRVVHAEMSAITEAARRGLSLKGATLYCTTFPCHICTRHIISSGIKRVVYIEPYPKSMAQRLYTDAITVQAKESCGNTVKFEPFLGISPNKYTDLFAMASPRRLKNGDAVKWKRGTANPRLERMIESYLGIETFAIGTLDGCLERAGLEWALSE